MVKTEFKAANNLLTKRRYFWEILGNEGAHHETNYEVFKIFKDAVSMYTCWSSLNYKALLKITLLWNSSWHSLTLKCSTFSCWGLTTIWNHLSPHITCEGSPTGLSNHCAFISKPSFYLTPDQNKKWGNVKWNKKTWSFSKSLTAHRFARIPLFRIQNKKAAHSWRVTINDVINLISQPSSKGIFILL